MSDLYPRGIFDGPPSPSLTQRESSSRARQALVAFTPLAPTSSSDHTTAAAAQMIAAFNNRVISSRGRDTPVHWTSTDARFIPKGSGTDGHPPQLLEPRCKIFNDAVQEPWLPEDDPEHTAFKTGSGGRDSVGLVSVTDFRLGRAGVCRVHLQYDAKHA